MENRTVQRVEYGHMKILCLLFVDKLDHPWEKEVASAGNVEGKENEVFGLWMVVEGKVRRVSNEKRNPKTKNPEKDLSGSRFNILE
ncbi:reverse transcriptase [Gossypium australe]|uniref:Reverse transcriptase n=1 Tax=Gossypium australe TaxID=47621 RepID=A0A5B6VJ41_9ROSI|nr:reverse transcriptase [Gossypium australe]